MKRFAAFVLALVSRIEKAEERITILGWIEWFLFLGISIRLAIFFMECYQALDQKPNGYTAGVYLLYGVPTVGVPMFIWLVFLLFRRRD